MEVLFVCSGNIMRSPLAEGLLRRSLEEIGVGSVVVASAGTLGIEGQPAASQARLMALERGVRLDAHRSRGVTKRDLLRADMILVMEQAHLDRLREIAPEAVSRAQLIREYESLTPAEAVPDLDDPIAGDSEGFRTCFQTLERCIANLALRLRDRRDP